MLMFQYLLKLFAKLNALLLFLSLSSFAIAAPFTVTYLDTIAATSSSPPYNTNEAHTITILLDNGGTSAASQTWTSADIISITFNMNDAPNTITTIFSPVVLTTDVGSFVTDAAGVLTAVPSNWSDFIAFGTPASSTILSTNDTNLPVSGFFINGLNAVYASASNTASMNNVANNIVAANWSNPAAIAPSTIPTLSQWAMILLSLMLLVIGLLKTRRSYK